jgi:hypothetical protein
LSKPCLLNQWFLSCFMEFWFDWDVGDWFVNYGSGDGWRRCFHPWSWCFVVHPWRCWLLVNSLGKGISLGGLAILSKVTHVDVMGGTCRSVAGKLFIMLSILWSASYSTILLLFLFCFRALVKSFRAFNMVFFGVKVGWVMYLCLKCTVSDILSLLVFLT